MSFPDAINVYNSMAEFYASMGGGLQQDVDFTIHRLEEIHGDVPVKSPLFRANYYSILLIRKGEGRYLVDWNSYNPQAESQTGSAIVLTFKRNLEAHLRDLIVGKCDR